MRPIIYIALILCTFSLSGLANNEISETTWDKSTKKHDYTESFKEVEQKEPKDRSKKDFDLPPGLMIIPLILLGIFLLVLIIIFIKNSPRISVSHSINISEQIEETEDPDLFTTGDLEQHLAKAIEDENYRLAIRIHFLILIKSLQDKELIKWRKEKTNIDYLNELSNKNIQQSLKPLILVFEKTWYANYPISSDVYKSLSLSFNQLNQSINE